MARQNGYNRMASSSADHQGFLRALIDAVERLVITISSRLRHTQIDRSPMGDSKGGYEIWKKLGSHLEKVSAESRPDEKPRAVSTGMPIGPNTHDDALAMTPDLNQLTEHSKRKAVSRLLSPMNERMQRKTVEHINIALILAKEGNGEGARLHIELAENAMHTAGRFMSHEEYGIFQQQIERRLESILDRSPPGDSET